MAKMVIDPAPRKGGFFTSPADGNAPRADGVSNSPPDATITGSRLGIGTIILIGVVIFGVLVSLGKPK